MANKKKKKTVSLPETEEILQSKAEQVEEPKEKKEPKKPTRKKVEKKEEAPVIKKEEIKEENKSKVASIRMGKIIRIFGGNMAMIEIDNVKSLISLGDSRRYKVGDIIQL